MISLVFPAYNPGPQAYRTWYAAREFVEAQTDAWEVLFVCDGCTDNTPDILNRINETDPVPGFRVIQYQPNRGKGYAVRLGLLSAQGRYRIFTDIDLAYDFPEILKVVDQLKAGAEVVVASRDHPQSRLLLPPQCLGYAYRRKLQSHLFRWLTQTLLPIGIADTQAGLKGMTDAVAEEVVPRLNCHGFGFDCELLTALSRLQIPIEVTPVSVRYEDSASTTGIRTTLTMIKELWSIRRAWKSELPPVRSLEGEPIMQAISYHITMGR